jgi:hypothetical protein
MISARRAGQARFYANHIHAWIEPKGMLRSNMLLV